SGRRPADLQWHQPDAGCGAGGLRPGLCAGGSCAAAPREGSPAARAGRLVPAFCRLPSLLSQPTPIVRSLRPVGRGVAPSPVTELLPLLLVTRLFEPVDILSPARLLDCDVTHRRRRRGAMPMLHAGRNPYDVARHDLTLLATPLLDPAGTGRDDQRL